ncbi:ImmA/IrrE family metallo-endopeptidase [Amycolatopsis sp. NPDC021455]|uniref:helix-turn-helix domain-containing protein n=1 Tax=Amycolatopsis sp. NPDC021455 TaxID=3154901 RepID=UPI0033FFF2B8
MTAIGGALATLRLARGYTQEQLATMVGVSQPAINRYEQDLREPDPDIHRRLADALGVTEDFLQHAGSLKGAMAVDAHMRRRASAKATDWRRLEAKLNEHRMHVSKLFEQVSLHANQIIPTFDPEGMPAADAARLTRMQWRMPVGPVKDLVGWLEAAGCVIVAEDFETARVDGLSQWINDHPVVMINQSFPTDRRRWTLAHELGHLCLHSEYISSDPETDANAFAAEFLMPEEVIRPQLRDLTTGKLADLKRQWGVSMQALVERAHQLRIMSAADRTAMYKKFSRLGWRVREPVSEELKPEIPRLTHSIAETLLSKGFSAEEVATTAGYADETRNEVFVPAAHRLRVV